MFNKEEQNGWHATMVKCDLCNNQWVAVFSVGCDKLDCPNCDNKTSFEIIEDTINHV